MDTETYRLMLNEEWVIRGSMISSTSVLEQHIEEVIAKYFCSDEEKSDELIAVIIGTHKLTFESKRITLKYVLEKKHPEFIKDNESWFADFERIMKVRNILAHHPLSTDKAIAAEEFKNGRIGFTKFNNKKEINYYTREEIRQHGTMIISYVAKFRTLLGLPI